MTFRVKYGEHAGLLLLLLYSWLMGDSEWRRHIYVVVWFRVYIRQLKDYLVYQILY